MREGAGATTDDRLADRDRSLAARRSAAGIVAAGRRTRCREGDADDRKRDADRAAHTQVLAQYGDGENGRHAAICRADRAHQADTAAVLEGPVEREVAKQAEQPGTDQAQRHAGAHAAKDGRSITASSTSTTTPSPWPDSTARYVPARLAALVAATADTPHPRAAINP